MSGEGGRLDLDAVRARVEAATRGPWIYLFDSAVYSATEESLDRICEVPEGDDRSADMEFISQARTDIPALLAEIDRLTAEVGEWVSVDERVPEDAEDVIVVDRYGNRRTAYLHEGTWYTTARYRFIPTHWQPLPAPPE